jgi:hypothetical protein
MKIMQIELNEVSKKIVDKLIKNGRLKNFKYLNENFSCVTTSSRDCYENIEPWIQWVSAHTGKKFEDHQVFHLGDAEKLQYSQVWEVLADNEMDSAIIGSMNAKKGRMKTGIFFPDPWAKDGKTHPTDLQPLWDLVASKVQTHATSKISPRDIFSGLKLCLGYRVPISMCFKLGYQTILQKINPKKKWRMPALFDELLSHIFMTILKRTDYSYYTLFLNACAHYQHHYWRDFDKSEFRKDINSPDIDLKDDPVSYGYTIYDKILGKLLKYIESNEDVALIIATAFTQEPYTDMEHQGGMNYYRLNNHDDFLNSFNIQGLDAYPMMSRDWQIGAINESDLVNIKSILEDITVNSEKVFSININGPLSIFISTAITRKVNKGEEVFYKDKSLGAFYSLFTNIAIKSGHHIADGTLWCSKNIPTEFLYDGMPVTQLYSVNLKALGVSNHLTERKRSSMLNEAVF